MKDLNSSEYTQKAIEISRKGYIFNTIVVNRGMAESLKDNFPEDGDLAVVLSHEGHQGCQIWHPNCVRLASNGTNLGIFKISFNTFWLCQIIQKGVLKSPKFVPYGPI